ncbi:MAG: tetratricopeptide repeat-containing glycosyltransferase family protein [Gemmatales bacterium]|nr:tetratricopeptide repeat-containing glycosyltransferase family protein [Gemmatales bacterium]
MATTAEFWQEIQQWVQLGQWSQAERLGGELCRTAQAPEWVNEWGVLLARHGRFAQAENVFRQLSERFPNYAPAYGNLGLVLRRLGRWEEAIQAFHRALDLDSQFVEALNNLALLLRDLNRISEALPYLERAVRLRPDQAVLHANLAQLYRQLQRHTEAVRHFRLALASQPGQLDICVGLSLSLLAMGEETEAESWARLATDIAPHQADAWNTLGTILSTMGRYQEAQQCFDEALRHNPQHHLAYLNRGMIYFTQGRWQQGWDDYEHRLYVNASEWQRFSSPRWQGEPLHGKTILLVAEQGIGDILQFVRYAQVLRQQGARVLLECPQHLVALLSRVLDLESCHAKGDSLPPYDVYIPLLSVPRYIGTAPNAIGFEVPYIAPSSDLVERWRPILSDLEGFRVGIAWQGNPNYPNDRQRSVPLEMFRSLAEIPGVKLVSLQKGPGEEQLPNCDFPVVDLGGQRDEAHGAFMDTAAILQHLDLVICTDSAIAHLAGALGRPVWLLLGYVCDWRWGTTGETTFWYPTMRLFRQPKRQDWGSVFTDVAKHLCSLVEQKLGQGRTTRVGDILVPISPGELVDKITILRIKRERITDWEKLRHVEIELAELERIAERSLPQSVELQNLVAELQAVNLALWQVEDELRDCERRKDFGSHFVELARSVYHHNDRRADIKKRINLLLGSRLVEEKSYKPYEGAI